MITEIAVVVVATVANLGLGILVVSYGRKSATSRAFFALCFSIAAWIVSTYISLHAKDPEVALFWTRFVMFTAVGQVLSLYLLVTSFPDDKSPLSRKQRLRLYGSALVAAIATLSPFLFTELRYDEDGTYTPTGGPGMLAFLPFALGYVVASFWILSKKYRESKGVRRTQTRFLLVGTLLFFIFVIAFNFLLPLFGNNAAAIALSPLFTIVFLGLTTYGIVRNHLFDIRVVVSRAIIYSGLLGTVLFVYGGTLFLISSFIDTRSSSTVVASIITAFILSFSFEPIHAFLSERTDTWLYKKEYEQREVTKTLSEQLTTALGLEEGLDVVMRTLTETLHLDKAVTYVFQQGELGKETIKRIQQIGYANKASLTPSDKDFLISFFTEHSEVISIRNLERELEEEAHLIASDRISKSTFRLSSDYLRQHAIKQAVLHKLKELDAAIAIPLHLKV